MSHDNKNQRSDLRNEIYNYILNNPGFHLREICRRMNISKTTFYYHVNRLEKQELIVKKHVGGYVRYYTSNNVGSEDKKILSFLRQDVPRRIVLFLLICKVSSRIELSRSLNLDANKVSYYLNKLVDMDIVESVSFTNKRCSIVRSDRFIERLKVCNERVFCLVDPDNIFKLLVRYHDSFDDDVAGLLVDLKSFIFVENNH